MGVCHIDTPLSLCYNFRERCVKVAHLNNSKGENTMFSKSNLILLLVVVLGVMLAEIVKPLVSSILTPSA